MKTLILVSVSLFTLNVMASGSNFNCSAQAKSDRNRSICQNSAISDSIKLAQLCPEAVKANSNQTTGTK